MQFSDRNQLKDRNVKNFRSGPLCFGPPGLHQISIFYNTTHYCDVFGSAKEETERRARRLILLLNEDEWRKSEAMKKVIGHK